MKKKPDNPPTENACPCGKQLGISRCCREFIYTDSLPETAEQLMRSRYTAYVYEDEKYLLKSWHSSTRPKLLGLPENPATKWLGLKVISVKEGLAGDSHGIVEFIARYKGDNGKAERMHEVSEFVREDGTWKYLGALNIT